MSTAGVDELTADERRILDFELRTAGVPLARRASLIRDEFDQSAARYTQRLFALIDTTRAEAAEPALVHRIRRLRDSRLRSRTALVRPGDAR